MTRESEHRQKADSLSELEREADDTLGRAEELERKSEDLGKAGEEIRRKRSK